MSLSNEPKYVGQEYIGDCICCGKKIYNIEDMKENVDEGVTCVLQPVRYIKKDEISSSLQGQHEIIIYGGYGSTTYDYKIGHVNDRELYNKIKTYMKDNGTKKAYICDSCCAKNSNKLFATEQQFESIHNRNFYFQQVPKKCHAFIYNREDDRNDLISFIKDYINLFDKGVELSSYDDNHLTFTYKFKDETITTTVKCGEVFILYSINLRNHWYNTDKDISMNELNCEVISEEEFQQEREKLLK